MLRSPVNLVVLLAPVVIAAAAAGPASAQDAESTQQGNTLDIFAGAADDVLANLGSLKFERRSLTRADPFTLLRDELRKLNNELDRAARLRIGFAWTALYQHATDAQGPRDASSGDFDFFGRWRPLQTRDMLGYVIFQAEARHKLFQDITPSELGQSIGSLWGTVNAFNERSFYLKQLYWQHFLLNNTLSYRLGKLDQGAVFNTNRLESDNLFFLNAAFSDNPTLPYPDNGLGVDIVWRPHRLFYLAYGAADANSSELNFQFDKNLQDLSWFTMGEVGLTPWIKGLGAGKYRLTGWWADASAAASQSDGWGVALSFDQELSNQTVGFLRYGYGDGDLTDTQQILSGGIGIKRPIGDNDDFAGIAAAWGSPSDRSLRDQWVMEGFYRLQLTPAIQVTADAQLIINPSNSPNKDAIGVFGVRMRVTF